MLSDELKALVANLRSSAKAFRENNVYDSEGDPMRLIVQADECDAAAAAIEALSERADALALQSDEWEGKYAIVSAMNEALIAREARIVEWLREFQRANDARVPTAGWLADQIVAGEPWKEQEHG